MSSFSFCSFVFGDMDLFRGLSCVVFFWYLEFIRIVVLVLVLVFDSFGHIHTLIF